MLTRVDIHAANGQTLSLPLQDVTAGFWIKEIEGLDPVKATIVSSPFGQLDGTQYQSDRLDNRNIVMKLGIKADGTGLEVSDLRALLYKFLMPKSVVTLQFFMDDVHFVDIVGKVEDLPTPLFSKDPDAKVSLICFDPDFVAPDSVVFPGVTTSGTTESVVSYPGNASAGFIFKLNVNATLTEFLFHNRTPDGMAYQMEFVGALQAGDVIEISTIPRNKYARLTRAGVQTSVLYGISPTASWFKMAPGDNNVRVQASVANIPYTIEYVPRYGGL